MGHGDVARGPTLLVHADRIGMEWEDTSMEWEEMGMEWEEMGMEWEEVVNMEFPPPPPPPSIPRYVQRLKALYFIKTRDERLSETRPKVDDILFACDELKNSNKLKKVLEVVLAFGNVMNRGNRGNAYGFKLSSLNRVVDTKSSAEKEMTLLHYVIKTLEQKVGWAMGMVC